MKNYHPPHHSRGYVLLLTLVLLAMVATSLAAVARRSFAASIDATRLEREAQRHWLRVSAENLLPQLENILSSPFDSSAALPDSSITKETSNASVSLNLDLGHHKLRLTLADEQAKANLNALWSRHDPNVVSAKVSVLLASLGSSDPVALRALGSFEATAAGSQTDWPTFVAFEQILPPEVLKAHLKGDDGTASLLNAVTLWGDGRLHAQAAGRPALDAVLTPLLSLGQVDEFERIRVESGAEANAISLNDLGLTDRQREQLAGLVTSTPLCHSVRLRFDDSRRTYTYLAVLQREASDQTKPLVRMSW